MGATESLGMPSRPLPKGSRWAKLAEVCEINPRRPNGFKRPGPARTTFVPMSAVDAIRGIIAEPETRPYAEVANGYTYFGEGDVLFAKITPCMQNGKRFARPAHPAPGVARAAGPRRASEVVLDLPLCCLLRALIGA